MKNRLTEGTTIAESIEGQADGKETQLRRELASGFEIVLQETRPLPINRVPLPFVMAQTLTKSPRSPNTALTLQSESVACAERITGHNQRSMGHDYSLK